MEFSLACCLIVKDEAPYLEEWLRYYCLQGADHFYICDDGSADGSGEILKEWEKNGKASVYSSADGFRTDAQAPQIPFYNRIIESKKDESIWCAFFDIDEFFQSDKTMIELLLGLNEDVSAVEINWCHYSSSRLLENDGRPVIERFLHRNPDELRANSMSKSVVKLSRVKPVDNAHNFEVLGGKIRLNAPLG